MRILLLIPLSIFSLCLNAQEKSNYQNPIIHADYSDPDVVRVGDDYYMTASSFNCVPGLPILHSNDLVNWELVNYALPRLVPEDVFASPQHGKGVWAPCIRFHKEEYYIFYPDPDFGIYMIKTKNPKGKWSEPVLIKAGKGLIDPSPLWDDDGKAYLVHAFAGSRAGIKSILVICTMKADGTKAYNDEVIVFDGHEGHTTVEGPKFYKEDGYYYIFAPAGGVREGWQLVLRSKNVYGPYEVKNVLEQGPTKINGPHQGAWVKTEKEGDWFIHFQDKDAYGRIVHMQPMKMEDGWPIMGVDLDKNGVGNPVDKYKKKNFTKKIEQSSDEFNQPKLALQWQWHANPHFSWGFPTPYGYYTMFCRPKPNNFTNLWDVSNLLMQKLPAEEFTATTKLSFHARHDNEKVGLVVMGMDYGYIGLKQKEGKLFLEQVICKNASKQEKESIIEEKEINTNKLILKVVVSKGGECQFYFSLDEKKFHQLGKTFKAKEGRWIGSKIGFFALREGVTNNSGSVDIDWFRVNSQ